MSLPFRAELEASSELEEAALWYEGQCDGLGVAFLASVDRALDHIARWPQAGAPVPDVPQDLAVRRVPINRFPYHVVYLELPDAIRILAVAHDRREPRYWHPRVSKL